MHVAGRNRNAGAVFPIAGFLFLLVWIPALAAHSAAPGSPRALQEVEDHLQAGEWARAEEVATKLLGQMKFAFGAGEGTKPFARALRLRAVARVAQDRQAEGLRDLYIARSVRPGPAGDLLGDYGGHGAFVRAHELREAGTAGEGALLVRTDPLPTGLSLPVPVEVPRTAAPREMHGKWQFWRTDIEFLIDEEGRVQQPIFHGEAPPGQIYLTLETLGSWKFLPARDEAGAPVAVVVRREELTHVQSALFQLAQAKGDGDLYRLGLAGRYEELQEALHREVQAALACDPEDYRACSPYRLANIPFLVAFAHAGLGRTEDALWAWQSAWSFTTAWQRAHLGALGGAAAALEDHPVRCWDPSDECEVPPARAPAEASDAEWEPPRIVERPGIEAPKGPEAPEDRLVVQLTVEKDGGAIDPRLVEGIHLANGYRALATVRQWRFEPAQQGGNPVASRIEVTVPFAPASDVAGGVRQVATWRGALDAVEENLAAGEWEAARGASKALYDELTGTLGRGGSELIAGSLRTLALAEASLGREEEARWHWAVAQNLAAELKWADLSNYGKPGEVLSPWRVPLSGEDSARLSREEKEKAPKKIAGAPPELRGPEPRANLLGEVHLRVDAEGKPLLPRVVVGGAPGRLAAALEALRHWRFEPAAASMGDELITEVYLPLTDARGKDPAERKRARLVGDLARAAAKNGEPRLASCYWAAAQNYDPTLPFGLSAEDPVDRILEQHYLRPKARWRGSVLCRDCEPKALAGGQVTAPVKLQGQRPRYTKKARKLKVQGAVVLQAVIETDGYLSGVKVLKGLPQNLDVEAIRAVCRWRFEPATFGGVPTPVYYNLSINFSL